MPRRTCDFYMCDFDHLLDRLYITTRFLAKVDTFFPSETFKFQKLLNRAQFV